MTGTHLLGIVGEGCKRRTLTVSVEVVGVGPDLMCCALPNFKQVPRILYDPFARLTKTIRSYGLSKGEFLVSAWLGFRVFGILERRPVSSKVQRAGLEAKRPHRLDQVGLRTDPKSLKQKHPRNNLTSQKGAQSPRQYGPERQT